MSDLKLTPAEYCVVSSIAAGLTFKQTAAALGFDSRGTVSTLLQRSCRKLGTRPQDLMRRIARGNINFQAERVTRLTMRAAMLAEVNKHVKRGPGCCGG